MSDLISRQALMKAFSDFVRESNNSDFEREPTWNDAVSLVEELLSIDAVQVIRCKDCKHWNGEVHDGFYYFEECAVSGLGAISYDYCSRAERKEG